jgi:hypothetical protein
LIRQVYYCLRNPMNSGLLGAGSHAHAQRMPAYSHQRTQVQSHSTPRTGLLLLPHARPPLRCQPLQPEGAAEVSFLSALSQVLRSLATRRIEPRHAGLYLHGFQLAARLASPAVAVSIEEPVRDLSLKTIETSSYTKNPPANLPTIASVARSATNAQTSKTRRRGC